MNFNALFSSLYSGRTLRTLSFVIAVLLSLAMVLAASPAGAQELPDAGRILQENLPTVLQPLEPSVDFDPQGLPLETTSPGGPKALVKQIVFSGNSVFDQETLQNVAGDVTGQSFDLSGLRGITNRISRYYRENGYPFARAYLPVQAMADGTLEIAVIEGRFGKVTAEGEEALAAGAQGFLRSLEPGSVIDSDSLERSILILGDQPGIKVIPVIRPGSVTGTGDLAVRVMEGPRTSGQVFVDNHGNRYSGEFRGQIELRLNRAIVFGDEIHLRGLYSNEDLWLGQAGYSLPLGRSGLRGWASYAQTEYDLRSPFEGYTGTARIASAGLTYPLIRSRDTNLVAALSYQHKNLDDELLEQSYEESDSDSWPLGLQFDHRDAMGGGGISYGELTLTPGNLNSDGLGAPEGSFTKVNLQLARLQKLPSAFSLFVDLSGQWADRLLHSSESFILGGAGGVRAFPEGEGAGNNGWLGQAELRYTLKNFTPYLFYDMGEIFQDEEDNRRRIAGAGIGLRCTWAGLFLDLSSAWKTDGGDARSDDNQRAPRFWFTVGYRF